jgi:hypothetical protein
MARAERMFGIGFFEFGRAESSTAFGLAEMIVIGGLVLAAYAPDILDRLASK